MVSNYSRKVLWGDTKEGAAVCAREGQTGFAEKVPVSPSPNLSHVWRLSGVYFLQPPGMTIIPSFFNTHIQNTYT